MSDDENDDKLTAGENKINICQINEMITCKVRPRSTFHVPFCILISFQQICSGYLVDATTVTECLHTFCKVPSITSLRTTSGPPSMGNLWPTIIPLWATSRPPSSNVF